MSNAIADLIDAMMHPDDPELVARIERNRWVNELADYNSRVAKGIMHRPEYEAQMAELQARFDAEQAC